jgi:hypothetical protein
MDLFLFTEKGVQNDKHCVDVARVFQVRSELRAVLGPGGQRIRRLL